MVTTVPALSAVLAENLIELDKLEEAAAEVDVDLGAAAHTFIEPFVLTTRGRVRFLLRRLDEAETDLRRVVAFCDARDWKAPNAVLGRLRLAEVLAASGQPEEALELMAHDVAAAQAAQRPGSLGMALRRRALAQHEPQVAIATLREAVAALEGTDLRRELGWALHDLGARLRIRGDRVEAREPLRGRSSSRRARSPRCSPGTRTRSSTPRARARAASGSKGSRRSRPPSGASRSSPRKGSRTARSRRRCGSRSRRSRSTSAAATASSASPGAASSPPH